MLKTSGQMRRFVFQIERQPGQGRQIDPEQMGFGGTHTLHFDPADRGIHPFATRLRHQAPLATVIPLTDLKNSSEADPQFGCLLLQVWA